MKVKELIDILIKEESRDPERTVRFGLGEQPLLLDKIHSFRRIKACHGDINSMYTFNGIYFELGVGNVPESSSEDQSIIYCGKEELINEFSKSIRKARKNMNIQEE